MLGNLKSNWANELCITHITQRHWFRDCTFDGKFVIRFAARIFFIHLILDSWSWVGRSSKVVHDTGLTSQPIGPIHVSSQPRIQQMTARASEPDSLLNSFLNKIDIYKVNCELHVLILILIYMWVLCGLRVLYNYLAEIFAPRSSSMEPELSTQ